jgi:opacity protein-like surface antigen
MKMTKIALLASAALAAVSMSARADDLSDLKARIAALEANAALTSVPAGFQLVTVGKAAAIVIPGMEPDKNYGPTATQIGITPTADMPASTVIQWSGFVRAALVYTDGYVRRDVFGRGADIQTLDVLTRAEIKVVGKTDTAVGEVGATVKLRAQYSSAAGLNRTTTAFNGTGKPAFEMPGGWGYWKMTPELTLGAGLDGSLAGNGYGYDGACSCYYTDNADAGYGNLGDPAQMRLTYASGPMSAAIALEDYLNDTSLGNSGSSLGVAGELKYAGDTVSGEVSAGYWAKPTSGFAPEDAYKINAGLGFTLTDMFKLSMSAGIGSNHFLNDDYWKANILASASLSDSIKAEIGYNHVDNESKADQNSVLAGVYYEPVSQLTIGLEGEWIKDSGVGSSTTADFVTVFRF